MSKAPRGSHVDRYRKYNEPSTQDAQFFSRAISPNQLQQREKKTHFDFYPSQQEKHYFSYSHHRYSHHRSTETSQLLSKPKEFFEVLQSPNNYIREIGALERRKNGRTSFYKRIGIEKEKDEMMGKFKNSTNLVPGKEEGVRLSEPSQGNTGSEIKEEEEIGVEEIHYEMVITLQKVKKAVLN